MDGFILEEGAEVSLDEETLQMEHLGRSGRGTRRHQAAPGCSRAS